MNRALDEYQIAGIQTNAKFLSYILNTDEFASGKYDINFIDNLNYNAMSSHKALINTDEYENAASILAALIKAKKKPSQKKNTSITNNNWWEQNYE
jgi:acetyl/propionyl-CoA carboxylase alpha subunit